jgi:hypothetical protein
LYGLLNWFDVFDYAVQKKEKLVEVMKFALETHGAHLLDNQSTTGDDNESKGSTGSKPPSKNLSLEGKTFSLELTRLRRARGIPDGKPTRYGQRSERQKKGREKKANQARGFVPGGSVSMGN